MLFSASLYAEELWNRKSYNKAVEKHNRTLKKFKRVEKRIYKLQDATFKNCKDLNKLSTKLSDIEVMFDEVKDDDYMELIIDWDLLSESSDSDISGERRLARKAAKNREEVVDYKEELERINLGIKDEINKLKKERSCS